MESQGQRVSRTTRGFIIEPKAVAATKKAVTFGGLITSAIWDPARQKIFGARGGVLMVFDADGVFETSLNFGDQFMGDAYIQQRPSDGTLWIGNWMDCNKTFVGEVQERVPSKGFFVIDPDSLAVINFVEFSGTINGSTSAPGLGSTIPCTLPVTEIPHGHELWFDPNDLFPPTPKAYTALEYETNPAIDYLATFGAGPVTIGPFPVACQVYLTGYFGYVNPGDLWKPYNWVDPGGIGLCNALKVDGVAVRGYVGDIIKTLTAGSTFTLELSTRPHFFTFNEDGTPATATFGVPSGMAFIGFRIPSEVPIQQYAEHFATGPRRFLFDANELLWITHLIPTDTSEGVFSLIDPDTRFVMEHAGIVGQSFVSTDWNCIVDDPTSGLVWMTKDACKLRGYSYPDDPPNTTGFYDQTTLKTIYTFGVGAIHGMDVVPSQGKLFMVTRSAEVKTMLTETPFTLETFDLGRPTARPRNIRYVPFKDRLYIPTMQDNAVLEVDPNNNTVTNTFTGFDLPWDIVATDEKVFAMQLGLESLRLVV